MMIETRTGGTREICGAKMKRPPEGHHHLICDNDPGHLPLAPNGPVVHVARDPGGMQLGAWKEGD